MSDIEDNYDSRQSILEGHKRIEYIIEENPNRNKNIDKSNLKQNQFSSINIGNKNDFKKKTIENIPKQIIQETNIYFQNDNPGIPQNINEQNDQNLVNQNINTNLNNKILSSNIFQNQIQNLDSNNNNISIEEEKRTILDSKEEEKGEQIKKIYNNPLNEYDSSKIVNKNNFQNIDNNIENEIIFIDNKIIEKGNNQNICKNSIPSEFPDTKKVNKYINQNQNEEKKNNQIFLNNDNNQLNQQKSKYIDQNQNNQNILNNNDLQYNRNYINQNDYKNKGNEYLNNNNNLEINQKSNNLNNNEMNNNLNINMENNNINIQSNNNCNNEIGMNINNNNPIIIKDSLISDPSHGLNDFSKNNLEQNIYDNNINNNLSSNNNQGNDPEYSKNINIVNNKSSSNNNNYQNNNNFQNNQNNNSQNNNLNNNNNNQNNFNNEKMINDIKYINKNYHNNNNDNNAKNISNQLLNNNNNNIQNQINSQKSPNNENNMINNNNFNNNLNISNDVQKIQNNNNININPQNPQNPQNCHIIEQNKYSFLKYTKAPKTGLKNMGDTSYLNAVLQLLGNIRNFASFFLNPKNVEYIEKNKNQLIFSFLFYRLFHHLYPYPEKNERELYEPKYILESLSHLNIVYKTKKRRNPNDLISFILNTLHNELNQLKNNKIIYPNNIYDKKNVVYCGYQNFINNNNSVISNLLNWFELKEIKCNKCNKNMYYFYNFNIFELDILGAYKNNTLAINDCLQYYSLQKTQNLFCQNCKSYTQMSKYSKIYSSPNCFIFSLDRKYLEQSLLQIRFLIEAKIDLSQYVEYQSSPMYYQLSGIVSYDLNNNKYVSFCMSPVDKHWYLYNDNEVEECQIDNILQSHNNNNQYIPCILFYNSKK